MSLLDLPDELLLKIIENLKSEKDILAILLASSRIYVIQQAGPLYKHNIRFSRSSLLRWYSGARVPISQCKDDGGDTPLRLAAFEGHEDIARLLLEKGADVLQRKGLRGWTPLTSAACNGYEGVLLLERGSDQKFKGTEYDQEQLLVAAQVGDTSFVNLLLERGADIECKDDALDTPLRVAALKGHDNVAKLLLENGADLEYKDGRCTARLLLEKGADIEVIFQGHEDVTRLLLEKGADIEASDKHGWTPLTIAALYGHESIARLLLENGSDIECEDVYGWTPLQCALKKGYEGIARLLLDKGADLERASRPTNLIV
ncbi:ankyrin repeat-containing domain protein [Aspergillus bertholletiae]|uniref:Ankyrin repeat-containing domain protein n=1 Tax=Aspergillus bertholletiae TaxID=1226010 RepID=A0A5N7B222_9EURO|nr:ankyrin repeat-containing domain protein [Aspergillus bertholletiae]